MGEMLLKRRLTGRVLTKTRRCRPHLFYGDCRFNLWESRPCTINKTNLMCVIWNVGHVSWVLNSSFGFLPKVWKLQYPPQPPLPLWSLESTNISYLYCGPHHWCVCRSFHLVMKLARKWVLSLHLKEPIRGYFLSLLKQPHCCGLVNKCWLAPLWEIST